jgi:DNA-directed RNA polymerase subunit E'/Rpb7
MQHVAVFEEQVPLTPKDLRVDIASIDSILEEKLRSRLEGRCSRHGFVLGNSVKILSRSMGAVERGRFTGNILFHVQAEGTVLNPPSGIILKGEVIRKNKMGLYVSYQDAVRIIVPRDLHIGNEEFEAVQVGDTVSVEIKKSRFQVNDEYILSVGVFQKREKIADADAVVEAEQEAIAPGASSAAAANLEAAVQEELDDGDGDGEGPLETVAAGVQEGGDDDDALEEMDYEEAADADADGAPESDA